MPFRTKKTKVYQFDLVIRGSRFRGTCGTEDFEEAKAIEAQIRADAKAQRSSGGAYTLSEALGTYHRDKMIGTPSEGTNAGQCRAVLKYMDGAQQIARMTDADVLAYVAKDRANCKNATVNRRLQMLGRICASIALASSKSSVPQDPRKRLPLTTMSY